jgi:glycosyltransferase involved in cell wall biosynthesis
MGRNQPDDILATMRLLHVVRTLNPELGGPSESVRMFVRAHQRAGNEVEVASLDGAGDGPAQDAYRSIVNCPVHACGPGRANYFYNPRLDAWLAANRDRFDGAIVNGLWQYQGVAARKALLGHKPYVVFAHGMLDPYFKNRYPLKHLKKLVYWLLQEHRTLNGAEAVCFTSEEEKRVAGMGFPLCRFRRVVVPYGTLGPDTGTGGVSASPEALRQVFFRLFPHLEGQRYLLFLGRIHPKKGCDLLVDAFARAAQPDLNLVMAGPDDGNWGMELKALAERLGIADRITWTGMLRGDPKWGAFYAAEAFVLPSHQENFGIAVADALACGVIPLISDKVNIAPDVAGDGAGLMEPDTAEGTERLIERFQSLTGPERATMRARALDCYRRRYALANAAEAVYEALGLA